MRVKYMPAIGAVEVVPTETTENGRNTDRDVLGKAIATVMPIAATETAPCREAAKQLVSAANEIIAWIEEADKLPALPMPQSTKLAAKLTEDPKPPAK